MCGVAGIFSPGSDEKRSTSIQRMAARLSHRGPDDSSYWLSPSTPIALGFCRLSILDLSMMAQQPMLSADGKLVMVFNGEIYNHGQLRSDLERGGSGFHSRSDSEVLLRAFECWGIDKTLERCRGMFAVALWDEAKASLTLIRDRFGEKPLYYGWLQNGLAFASELKALTAIESSLAVDEKAVDLFLKLNYIPAPYSIYQGIFKLPAGTFLTLKAEQLSKRPTSFSPSANSEARVRPEPYWELQTAIRAGQERPFSGSLEEASLELTSRLREVVSLQMIADRPLGAFLSGGIDSSTIVALMREISSTKVKTFSIGFSEDDYDEARYAAKVARHLGTDHSELLLTSSQALEVIPEIPSIYDEPFADASQIPTYLVSRLAKERVTVCLSGDGGDELFGGYDRYQKLHRIWQIIARIPSPLRTAAGRAVRGIRQDVWEALSRLHRPMHASGRLTGERIHQWAELLLNSSSCEALYFALMAQFSPSLLLSAQESAASFPQRPEVSGLHFQEYMMAQDLVTYLPDDILAKVDRAAMAVSLETRAPFLDHTFAEFVLSLPLEHKLEGGVLKRVLREALYRLVPRELVERRKMGFCIPTAQWLRGPLREWAGDCLGSARIQQSSVLNAKIINQMWNEHLGIWRDRSITLWAVLMLAGWLEKARENTRPASF